MYPTKAEHEVPQQMATGYPPSFQNPSAPQQHLQPPTHSYPQQHLQPPTHSYPQQHLQPPTHSYPQQHLQPSTHSYPQQGGLPHSTKWSSGLCGCTEDPSNCCLTCFCPCITFGQIAEIVDEGSPACALSGGVYAALCYFTGCACCYACVYRNKMRAKYNLAESPCTDCLVHCFCDSCALCQEYRELKHRGFDPALGWRGPGQQQGMGHAMAAPGYATMQK